MDPSAETPLWRQFELRSRSEATTSGAKFSHRTLIALVIALGLIGAMAGALAWFRAQPRTQFVGCIVTRFGQLDVQDRVAHDADLKGMIAAGYIPDTGKASRGMLHRGELIEKFLNLRKASQKETVVIYLSSYATLQEDADVDLIPSDWDLSDGGASLAQLMSALRDCPAERKLLLLDITPFTLTNNEATGVQAAALNIVEQLNDPNLAVLFSCSPGQLPQLNEALGRSLFGYYVETGLQGDADGWGSYADGRVIAKELAEYVRARTIETSLATTGVVQAPYMVGETSREWELSSVGVKPNATLVDTERKYPEWLTNAWNTRNTLLQAGKDRFAPGAFDQLDRVLLQSEREWRLGSDSDRLQRDFELANHFLSKQLADFTAVRQSFPNVSLSDYREEGIAVTPDVASAITSYFVSLNDLASLPNDQRIAAVKKLQTELQAKLKTATRMEIALALDDQLQQLEQFEPSKFSAASDLLQLWEPHPRQIEEAYWLWLARMKPGDPSALRFYNCISQQQEISSRLEPLPWVLGSLTGADQSLHAAKVGLTFPGYLPSTWNAQELSVAQPQLDRMDQLSSRLATAYDVTRRGYRLRWLMAETAVVEPDSSVKIRTALQQIDYLMTRFSHTGATVTPAEIQSEMALVDQGIEISVQLGKALSEFSQLPADAQITQWIADLTSSQPTVAAYRQADMLLRAPWVPVDERAQLCAALRKASFTLTSGVLNAPSPSYREVDLEAHSRVDVRLACYLHGFYYPQMSGDESSPRSSDAPTPEQSPAGPRWERLFQLQADYRLLQMKRMHTSQDDGIFDSVERRLALVASCPTYQLSNSIGQVTSRNGRTSIEVDYRVMTSDSHEKTPQIDVISPTSYLKASVVSSTPDRSATIRVQATPEATPSQLAVVQGVMMTFQTSWGTIYRPIPLPPMFDHELELLVADTPDGPQTALTEIDLRPIAGRQTQYWFLRNVTDKSLSVNLQIGAGEIYQQKLDIPPRGVAPVIIAGKPIAAPAPLPTVSGSININATEATSGDSLLQQVLPVRVLTPRSYVQVTDTLCEYRPGGARITATLAATNFPSGPPSTATIEITQEEFPALVNIVGGVLSSTLASGDEQVQLSADLLLSPTASQSGQWRIAIDGYSQAFRFDGIVPSSSGLSSPSANNNPAIRLQAPQMLRTGQPLSALLIAESAPDGASLVAQLGIPNSDGFLAERTVACPTPQQSTVGFSPIDPKGAIQWTAQLNDWNVELDTTGIVGRRRIQLQMLDADGNVIDQTWQTIVIDDTPPRSVRFTTSPTLAQAKKPATFVATAFDGETGIAQMQMFIGEPFDNAVPKDAKLVPMVLGNDGNFSAQLTLNDLGRNFVTVVATNGVGIQAFKTTSVHVLDELPPPMATIRGVVLEAGRPQPGLTVTLAGADGKPIKTSETSPSGEYVFGQLTPGAYKLSVVKAAAARNATAAAVGKPDQTTTVDLNLTLQ
ncbi:carboxypeptidase regulatory-like domain-containing protein [Blastopirellula sp. JC732]|uniref:Carboxypeptidase regulatory-like domain-containing protein n=1 Tax=Blastopirellula sediminis TaxID=2894196 RepID=A0A9X1SH95_9BACT|nr:carboxypeptidase regulatory-like domain-containing protein [Blastopirellula sediminis]MCC9606826.1 carboxypeptidase regulatory-like domain-containing protein [Blastopirellula sediminis]MCC9629877.1 carboxypeptidase regulatory-like domain-containing protein [Blastopirellula sediminis]